MSGDRHSREPPPQPSPGVPGEGENGSRRMTFSRISRRDARHGCSLRWCRVAFVTPPSLSSGQQDASAPATVPARGTTTSTATMAGWTATCRRLRSAMCSMAWTSSRTGRCRSRSSRIHGRSSPRPIRKRSSRCCGAIWPMQRLSGRIEIVSGVYGQAYMWNASGECNIRQIAYGLAELRAIFPDLVVDTYAVQEPCWTSCLPQILKSFGYRRAVLKNSTCWGGYYASTLDADLVNWTGPDGHRQLQPRRA